jgi:Bifunctional DNA primase/polymerase, N-terminal
MESLDKLRRASLLRGVWGKARTPSGGLHLLFAPSTGGNHSTGRLGIDYRGRGGYIAAAPSVTEAGMYQWDTTEPGRRELTFDWEAAKRALGLIKPPPRQAFTGNSGNAEGLVRTVAEAQEGERNARLYWAARRAADDGIDPEILREPARAVGLSDSEISRTLASAVRAAAASASLRSSTRRQSRRSPATGSPPAAASSWTPTRYHSHCGETATKCSGQTASPS